MGMLDEHDDGGEVHQQRIVGLARRKPRITHRSGFPVTDRLLRGEHIPATLVESARNTKELEWEDPIHLPQTNCGRRASNTKCTQCACGTVQCSLIFIGFAHQILLPRSRWRHPEK